MALQYKPTRMELSNLKKRRTVAVRGHKMMKDKRDELVRRFITYARRNQKLRQETEAKLQKAMQSFVLARAMMSSDVIRGSAAVSGAFDFIGSKHSKCPVHSGSEAFP